MLRGALSGVAASLTIAAAEASLSSLTGLHPPSPVAAEAWSPTIVDLSSEWELGELYNTNDGSEQLANLVKGDVHGYVVLVGGKVVAEHYASGRDKDSISQIWSVTKSWSAMLIGTLMRDGLVASTATLAEIFPSAAWSQVQDASAKRNITLQALLTMRSGMHAGGDIFDQDSLVAALNYCSFDASKAGEFHYVNHHLLAYVVHAITGETPAEYAERLVWPSLGINASQFTWWANAEGVQNSAFGLNMAPRHLAKLGQLYLQRGQAGPAGAQLLDPGFVDDSATSVGGNVCPGGCGHDGEFAVGSGYSYQFWTPIRTDDLFAFSAVGHNGQFVTIFPERDMLVAITGDDSTGYGSSSELLALIPRLDFSKVPEDDVAAPTSPAGTGLLVVLATAAILSLTTLDERT